METMRGVLSPVITPFRADLSVDVPVLAAQCRWLLDADVGLAIFGTNSEGNSMSAAERAEVIAGLVSAGIPAARMMPGTGACALDDAVALTRSAVKAGVGGVLVLPPFYYKGVSDDGLFAFFSELIERVGDAALRLYLYHIPPVAQVPLSLALIERLLGRYGPVVAGIKDSGGQWDNTAALIERFAARGFAVFAGSETFLLQTLRAGGAGCISATANVNPAAIADLYRHRHDTDAEQRQQRLDQVRKVFAALPMIAAMKSAMAQATGLPDWTRLRPPLVGLSAEQQATLRSTMAQADFRIQFPRAAA
ncbi:MAG: dihydrodipicolinate synthase family protein [Rubrivivax sp.]|nr:dihydrodipicolinate synthase family protein [Rubrivivax sp.]